jgi:Sigma-70 region 2
MMQALQSQTELPPNTASQTLERSAEEFHGAVSRHLPMLHKRAYRYSGNAHDAEDAVQDVLWSAYKHSCKSSARRSHATGRPLNDDCSNDLVADLATRGHETYERD